MRKTFTTTIKEEIQKEFKIACIRNGINMNDALENFMERYIKGELKLQTINSQK